MSLQDRFEELSRRNQQADAAGGPERIERQHKAGKKTARERLEILLDKGSFAEVDRFVVHQNHDFGMDAQRIPGDGVVTGSGRVHGRPVFALPGRVDNQMSAGPHQLIRDGATLVTKLEDIISALDPLPDDVHQPELFPDETQPEKPVITPPSNLSDRQQLILSQLGSDPAAVDAIIDKTNLPAPAVLQELTFLTLRGLLKRAEGQSYIRT